jgi:hypothetical protein
MSEFVFDYRHQIDRTPEVIVQTEIKLHSGEAATVAKIDIEAWGYIDAVGIKVGVNLLASPFGYQ